MFVWLHVCMIVCVLGAHSGGDLLLKVCKDALSPENKKQLLK